MSPETEQVLQAAMALPEDQQRELVEALLRGQPSHRPAVEPEWDTEAECRLDEILDGRAVGRPLDEFLAELRGRRS